MTQTEKGNEEDIMSKLIADMRSDHPKSIFDKKTLYADGTGVIIGATYGNSPPLPPIQPSFDADKWLL